MPLEQNALTLLILLRSEEERGEQRRVKDGWVHCKLVTLRVFYKAAKYITPMRFEMWRTTIDRAR
jgi:hypothetical protein